MCDDSTGLLWRSPHEMTYPRIRSLVPSRESESHHCRSPAGWPEVRHFSGQRKEAPQVFQSPIMSRAWSLYRRLANRGRDKIAPETRAEFTLGISSPYIWASTGNATIVSRDPSVKCCPGQYFTGLARFSSFFESGTRGSTIARREWRLGYARPEDKQPGSICAFVFAQQIQWFKTD